MKLLDFGLAYLLGREDVSGGGTPAYMAPEQARGGTVDERSDVYAAAMVLREMLSKAGSTNHPVLPRAIARIITSALADDPSERPRDGAAWLDALLSARRTIERPRRVRRLALFASTFLVLGLVITGFATWRVWRMQLLEDPDGRTSVAVADFANQTGDSDSTAFRDSSPPRSSSRRCCGC